MEKKKGHGHHLTYHLHKGKISGVYIAKLVEIPGIIVYSKSKDEIYYKLKEALDAYFDAFPDQHDVIFKPKTEEETVESICVSV